MCMYRGLMYVCTQVHSTMVTFRNEVAISPANQIRPVHNSTHFWNLLFLIDSQIIPLSLSCPNVHVVLGFPSKVDRWLVRFMLSTVCKTAAIRFCRSLWLSEVLRYSHVLSLRSSRKRFKVSSERVDDWLSTLELEQSDQTICWWRTCYYFG